MQNHFKMSAGHDNLNPNLQRNGTLGKVKYKPNFLIYNLSLDIKSKVIITGLGKVVGSR